MGNELYKKRCIQNKIIKKPIIYQKYYINVKRGSAYNK